jgi:hypothetical protein
MERSTDTAREYPSSAGVPGLLGQGRRGNLYSGKVQQPVRTSADWRAHSGTVTCGDRRGWTCCLLMACKRSGVRISLAPRFRSSEAVYADLDRLLIVQEVTLSGELACSGVPAGQRAVAPLIGHSGCGWVLPGAKRGASRLSQVLPQAAYGRPGLPAQRRCRHAGWTPRRASEGVGDQPDRRFGVTSRMARSARWVAQNCQFWYLSDGARSAGLISPFGRLSVPVADPGTASRTGTGMDAFRETAFRRGAGRVGERREAGTAHRIPDVGSRCQSIGGRAAV